MADPLPPTPPEIAALAEAIAKKRVVPPKSKPRKPGKRASTPSPRVWAEIEVLYAAGDLGKADLAKRFGISRPALTAHMKAKGIEFGSKGAEVAAKAAAAAEKALNEDTAVLAARIRETKDQHYQMSTNLAKLVWAEVLTARAEKVPVGSKFQNIKALQTAANALKQCREERFAVLGLDGPDAADPSEIPELIVSELTADQVEALRNAKDSDYDIEELEPMPEGAIEPDEEVVSEGDDSA